MNKKTKEFFDNDKETQSLINNIKNLGFGLYDDKTDFIEYVIKELKDYQNMRIINK